MAKVLSSISGNLISAASAGYAPTNSADVSAIASAYQVVSATATQLYAGTAYLTSVNDAPVSASRAGNAANASMATSAYYDGTGRLISALPDSASVSSIASSYAESAASGKLDTTAQVVSATAGDGTYVTSINGMGLSGQGGGGAQVVTATGSASALSGIWPVITSYFVSSINGSALLPYGYSALSGNSANWNNARTAVTANSANWNSVYNTVSSNSASWSGSTGGGSVTSPSGTIVVRNGNEIEGTNSAALTASSEGFEELLYPQRNNLQQNMGLLTYGTVPDTGATLMIPLQQTAYADIRVILSGRFDTGYGYTSASGIIPSGALTANIPMDGITGDISASSELWIDLAYGYQLTAKKESGILVTGIGELSWKSAVDNVTNTVSANSASWGGGASLPITGEDPDSDTTAIYEASALGFSSTNVSGGMYSNGIEFRKIGAVETAVIVGPDLINIYSMDTSTYMPTGLMINESSMTFQVGYDTYSIETANVSAWNDVHDTVSANSATWGAGATLPIIGSAGTDSATYGETSVEFYRYDTAGEPDIRTATLSPDALDITYTVDENDYYSVHINENGVEFSDPDGYYTVTPYDITNWNSAVETVANNSATWGQGGVDSATVSSIASSYAESAASSKMDTSAMTSYALSADVSGTVDLVSTQSANWGGSALALSAGPGVKLEKVGNTLVVGADETVLWSGSMSPTNSAALAYPLTDFERIRFTWRDWNTNGCYHVEEVEPQSKLYALSAPWFGGTTSIILFHLNISAADDYGTVKFTDAVFGATTGTSYNSATSTIVTKIVGINRTAGV